MLLIEKITCTYGRIPAVEAVSLEVQESEIVALIGSNGAGKTTLLRAISGLHQPESGNVYFEKRNLNSASAPNRVRQGLVQVPEGRRIFSPLTIEDNLQLGGVTQNAKTRTNIQGEIYEMFPILYERRKALAGSLSGGEQQMLAIGRALMSVPKLLILDEPSLGLAPKIISQILQQIKRLNQSGTAILLVEQNAIAALGIADRAYVMESGRITKEGPARELLNDPSVRAAYLGG